VEVAFAVRSRIVNGIAAQGAHVRSSSRHW
jgi:hypothetical protein